jgi:hypothetical protein
MKGFTLLFIATTLFSCDLIVKQKPSETVTVYAPVSKSSEKDPLDSSYLRIRIIDDQFKVSLFEKLVTTNRIDAVDSFINANKDLINHKKVSVISPDTLQLFQQLRPVLMKHDLQNFYIHFQ